MPNRMIQLLFEFKPESSEEMKGFLEEVNRKNERINMMSLKYFPIGIAIYFIVVGCSNVIYCFLRYGYVSTDHLFYPAKFSYVSKFKNLNEKFKTLN